MQIWWKFTVQMLQRKKGCIGVTENKNPTDKRAKNKNIRRKWLQSRTTRQRMENTFVQQLFTGEASRYVPNLVLLLSASDPPPPSPLSYNHKSWLCPDHHHHGPELHVLLNIISKQTGTCHLPLLLPQLSKAVHTWSSAHDTDASYRSPAHVLVKEHPHLLVKTFSDYTSVWF